MTRQLTAILAAVAFAVALLTLGPAACRKWQAERAQSRVDKGQAEAGAATGGEAMNTFEGVTANAAATDATVGEAVNAVHAAPEAEKARVAAAQACKFKANANKPECKGTTK